MCKKTKTSARFSKTVLWPILDSFLIISKIAKHCNGRQRLCSETKRDFLKKCVILYHDHFSQVLYYLPLGYDKKQHWHSGAHTITVSLAVMVENTLWAPAGRPDTQELRSGDVGLLLLAPRSDAALILQTLSGSGHPGLLLIRLCKVSGLGRVNTDLTMSMMELLTPDRKIKNHF